jgi:hypothetical protein
MSNIQNAGKKGYFVLYLFIALLLFFSLVVYIYQYNQLGLE